MYIRYTWFSDKSFSSFKVKRSNYSLYVLNINTHLMQMTSYRSERKKNLSREGERNGVISMQKETCFFQVFIADEVSHVKYATIMLTGNCPWQRPVKRFGTLSLRSRDRSLPIAAFRSTDVSLCQSRISLFFFIRDFSTLLNTSVFRLHSQRRQLTIARDLKSASFTVTDARRYSLIMAFSKKLPDRAISSSF